MRFTDSQSIDARTLPSLTIVFFVGSRFFEQVTWLADIGNHFLMIEFLSSIYQLGMSIFFQIIGALE